MKFRIPALILALALLMSGCSDTGNAGSSESTDNVQDTQSQLEQQEGNGSTQGSSVLDTQTLFSDRDLAGDIDESGSVSIRLTGNSAACNSSSVRVSGSTVTITGEGTYILSGTLNDGMIIVDADKQEKVQLVLSGVSINSQTSAPIYVVQADKVFVTLAEGTRNTLSNGGSFTAIDESNIDSVIFSKEDLTLNGSGSLAVTSPAGHGIVSKDELTITGGEYSIQSSGHGVTGKDSVAITNAVMTIVSGKDGIHAEHDEDTALGYAYIAGGTFDITAEGDGISASAQLQIDGGSFTIVTGGGSVNAQKQTSDNWGGFGGGGRPGGSMGGGPMGGRGGSSTSTQQEDSTSIKAIKASADLVINGGSFTIDAADDAIHANASVTVTGGSFTIATGDDGFHADEALRIAAGSINITESYEGLEGLCIELSGGEITLVSSDDGLNAAGGTDSSGFGGFRGGDMFAASDDSYITISGGTLFVDADGDGIDSNGNLTVSGGYTVVEGPTDGGNGPLDYAGSASISGGTVMITGSVQMAQSIGADGQGVLGVSTGSQPGGTAIQIIDTDGSVLLSWQPKKSFACVVVSCPEMESGATYTIKVGSLSGELQAD